MEHRPVGFEQETIEAALSGIALGGLRVYQTVASSNDEALAWAASGAPDMSLVVADEQTAGRGRSGRTWSTPPNTSLAISLVVRNANASAAPMRLAGLGALAVAEACEALGLAPKIKWPNDVLLLGRKVAGVLVESSWNGAALEAAVVGIGINVLAGSTPPAQSLRFPAIDLEACLTKLPDRVEVLRLVVSALSAWRPRVGSDAFIGAWVDRLAFRGEEVVVTHEGSAPIRGRVDGLEDDGRLRLITPSGIQRLSIGELRLAAAGDTMP